MLTKLKFAKKAIQFMKLLEKLTNSSFLYLINN